MIRAYGLGLIARLPLSIHYEANLERARKRWREERSATILQGAAHTKIVVAAGELSHNADECEFI